MAFELVASITEQRRDLINQAAWCAQLNLPSQPTELGRGFACPVLSELPSSPFLDWRGRLPVGHFSLLHTGFLAPCVCCQLPSLHPEMIRKLTSCKRSDDLGKGAALEKSVCRREGGKEGGEMAAAGVSMPGTRPLPSICSLGSHLCLLEAAVWKYQVPV